MSNLIQMQFGVPDHGVITRDQMTVQLSLNFRPADAGKMLEALDAVHDLARREVAALAEVKR